MSNADAEIVAILTQLPPDTDPNFPPRLAETVLSLPNVRERLASVLNDPVQPPAVSFAALYGFLSHARRNKDFQIFTTTLEAHMGHFGDRPLMILLRSQRYLNFASEATNARQALELARQAQQLLPDHFGVIAQVAEAIACASEAGCSIEDATLREGLGFIDRAMALQGGTYGRYWVTRAKLAAQLQWFDDATNAIEKAIDIEPSGRADYPIRIGDFQAVRLRIQAQREIAQFAAAQESTIRQVEGLRNELFTALGLLTGVVALVIGSTTMAVAMRFVDAARLILVLAVALLFAFAGFASLSSTQDLRRSGVVILGALLLLVIVTRFWPSWVVP